MATIEEMAELPLNLHEYEALARDLLSPMTLGYVSGGSCDEVTLRANRAAFDRWRLLPRVMRGLRETSTATTVLGQEVALPVLIGPSGLHRLAHDEGELATIRGAHGAGTIYTMSTASTVPMDIISRESAPWWFQLYLFSDRGISRDLVERAAAAGAAALVVTVDVPLLGRREADERNRFSLPDGLVMANLQTPKHMLIPATDGGSGLATYIGAVWEPALTWDDLDWLASLSPLPVIPKGILHPEDAARAVDYGARAVIVSNHGGRQLDSAARRRRAARDGCAQGAGVGGASRPHRPAGLLGSRPGRCLGGAAHSGAAARRADARPDAVRPGQSSGGDARAARPGRYTGAGGSSKRCNRADETMTTRLLSGGAERMAR
ncbi:MAG: FMN-dependent alpha-hydroxy acid dehydrogenase [Thermomicrobiales bacterium]|nr:FMN-dependent alpha-hydroxy acid dehydrogenase [Thermomicrobiales bacterium]